MTRTFLSLILSVFPIACTGARPHDVAGDRRLRVQDAGELIDDGGIRAPPPAMSARPTVGEKPHLLLKATARALAVDDTTLFYGDTTDDSLYAVPKSGGAPVRISHRAPVTGSLSVENDSLTWVGTPGDMVLRIPKTGGAQTTVREHGIFADVAVNGGDAFVAEVSGAGGIITRVTGTTSTRLAVLDTSPRGIAADDAFVYVATSSKLVRLPRTKGEVETLASGGRFENPELAGGDVLFLLTRESKTTIARVPKTGGPIATIVADVRDGPIAIAGDSIVYFDGRRPEVRIAALAGGEPRVVARDATFAQPLAIAADAKRIFVSAGDGETSGIFALTR